MDDEKRKFTQDDVIDKALAEFGTMLKNRHALMRQIAKDYYAAADKPIAVEAFDNVNALAEHTFRMLCTAAEWQPSMEFPRHRLQSALADHYYYRELMRTLPPAEFNRLVMGEWIDPTQPGDEG